MNSVSRPEFKTSFIVSFVDLRALRKFEFGVCRCAPNLCFVREVLEGKVQFEDLGSEQEDQSTMLE